MSNIVGEELSKLYMKIELSVKSSKESTESMSLLKTGNKVVEVGWVHSKVEDEEGTTVGSKLGTST
jgi:TRAP-type uncharacterized transport system substrate-binding protein